MRTATRRLLLIGCVALLSACSLPPLKVTSLTAEGAEDVAYIGGARVTGTWVSTVDGQDVWGHDVIEVPSGPREVRLVVRDYLSFGYDGLPTMSLIGEFLTNVTLEPGHYYEFANLSLDEESLDLVIIDRGADYDLNCGFYRARALYSVFPNDMPGCREYFDAYAQADPRGGIIVPDLVGLLRPEDSYETLTIERVDQ